VRTCGECRTENPDDARFCTNCGTEFADRCANCAAALPEGAAFCPTCGHAVHTEITEERRFLTVLFADIVGFTAGSDEADPEDVQARLTPYHRRLRQEIERYHGTVEKLIGDGVMAVFGVPTAHEDDPERAVRTALRIQAAVDALNEEHPGLDLAVRIGINTGEAVVTTGGRGERIVGDVVNTASRLESIAPPGGVVVGETTYRATHLLNDYEEMDPVEVKGKSKPLPVWRAIEPRGRYGIDAAVRADTPFVGRESEMRLLTEIFRRVVDDGSLQLVTVAAGAGVGKSRLVNEFWRWADDQPEIVWWRQGRCLPYGEGITFWALGEIVKGQAGIRESDSPAVARQKLHTALEATTADPADREWLASQVSPLVGAGEDDESGERGEAFAAWRRFLEDVAAVQPLVMVVEDLHWADAAFVGFLEDLLIWSSDTPIMVICTARPELYQTHQGWGGGQQNSTTISLAPLGDQHIALLLGALLDRAVLPAETQETLLSRAGGNPLFAVEFVRMLKDRGMLEGHGRIDADALDAVPVPETLQSLIGSRLDVLSTEESRAIEDASVVGKVFWQGALEAISPGREAEDTLRRLVTREWIRPVRDSSIDGEREYAFWHALTRDVAYGRIPRRDRARKHRTMAEWIRAATGERVADHAELLAHHYLSAWELGRAIGADGDGDLRDRTIDALILSGDRAWRLDASRSYDYHRKALDLMPEDDPRRPAAMVKAGEAMGEAGAGDPVEMLREAAELALEQGDRLIAGEALAAAHRWRWLTAGTGAGTDLLDRAIELLEAEPPSDHLADAYLTRGGYYLMRGDLGEQLRWARRGLELLDDPGADIRSRGLTLRGIARFHLGDVEAGMADLEGALRVADEEGVSVHRLSLVYVNLADHTWWTSGPHAAEEIFRRGIERVEGRGGDASWLKAETMWTAFDLGTWDVLLATGAELIRRWEGEPSQYVPWAQSYQAHVHIWRGEVTEAAALMDAYLPTLREIADVQLLAPALVISARIAFTRGEGAAARKLLGEYVSLTEETSPAYSAFIFPDPIRMLVALDDLAAAEYLARSSKAPALRSAIGLAAAEAILTEARGDIEGAVGQYRDVAEKWGEFGHVLEEALARHGASRCLADLARGDEARQSLAEARRLFDRLGARPMIAELDESGETAAGM